MRKPDRLDLPLECLRDIKRWLKSAGVRGVVIGGVAAGLLGTSRATHDVDVLVFGTLEFERELIARSMPITVGRVRVPVPTPEDLIILKAIPRRPNDLADIAELLHHHSRLDLDRVWRIAGDFAEALDCPKILDDLERLLRLPGKKKKKR